jgi:hypothetical protein
LPFSLFYCPSVYFFAIWYILWSIGIYFPILVCYNGKNLATLSIAAICSPCRNRGNVESMSNFFHICNSDRIHHLISAYFYLDRFFSPQKILLFIVPTKITPFYMTKTVCLPYLDGYTYYSPDF